MTSGGGSNGDGAIISFNPSNNAENVVTNFSGGTDGESVPYGDLVYYGGLYYGMTLHGGSSDSGAIISFNPTGNIEKRLYSFAGNPSDGSSPSGSLIYDAENRLFYGMTSGGGSNGDGVIFDFNPTNDSEKVVWDFGTGMDGKNPFRSLVPYKISTGINTVSKISASINIYPNPNNGNFTIQLQNVKRQNTQIEIFNVLGEKIYTTNLNSTNTQINLNNNAGGIYLFRVLDEQDNLIGEGKLVIE